MRSSFAKLILVMAVLPGCGASTNFLGRTVPPSHKENFFYNLDMARALYDSGSSAAAYPFAQKAFHAEPDSEEASLLLGFINLSLAGGDPIDLALAITQADQKRSEDTSDEQHVSGSKSQSAADVMMAIKGAVGLSQAEIDRLGTIDNATADLPILIPVCAEVARENITRLQRIHEAIRASCPFVDPGVLSDADYRQSCKSSDRLRQYPGKAHILWAFSHLTEALIFNAALSYTTDPGASKTNLEQRVDRLKDADVNSPDAVSELVASVTAVEKTVDSVFPVSGSCSVDAPTSMLRATLNDLLAVDSAFSHLVGAPENIVTTMRRAVAKINELGGTSGITGQLNALKSDFNKNIGTGLAAKIEQMGSSAAGPLSEQQTSELCQSLESISPQTALPPQCS